MKRFAALSVRQQATGSYYTSETDALLLHSEVTEQVIKGSVGYKTGEKERHILQHNYNTLFL